MTRIAQILSAIFVLILGSAGAMAMFNPALIGELSGFNPIGDYGITNVRTLGAPTLSLAIITAIGLIRRDWLLILPASMYFFLNGSSRVISVIVEGYDPIMLRGLLITFALFGLSQIAIYLYRRAGQSMNFSHA